MAFSAKSFCSKNEMIFSFSFSEPITNVSPLMTKSMASLAIESYFCSANSCTLVSKDLVTHEKESWYKHAKNNKMVKTQMALLFLIKIFFVNNINKIEGANIKFQLIITNNYTTS